MGIQVRRKANLAVFRRELAACSLARSIESMRKTRQEPFKGLSGGAFLQQAHLLDGELAQRAIGREGQKIGVSREDQGIVVAFIGGPFFAVGD